MDADRPRTGAARRRRRGQGPQVVVAQNVAFGVIAAAMALAAIGVVTSKNVVHAALYLVIVLAGVAAQYVLLTAEFVAWVQVLIYIGAIIVLFLFGIMLTRAPMGHDQQLDNDQRWLAAVVGVFMLGLLAYALGDAFGWTHVDPNGVIAVATRHAASQSNSE